MLLGVPVIGTQATGTCDLIESGLTGTLIAPEQQEAELALLAMHQDPEQSTKLADAARAKIEGEYEPEACLRRLEKYYESVVRGSL